MKTIIKYTAAGCVIMYMALLAGCGPVEFEPPVISEIIHITVLMPDGEPADSVEIQVWDKHSEKEFHICPPEMEEPCIPRLPSYEGGYVIFPNELQNQIGRQAEILVEGTRDTLFFREEFTIRSREHVSKIAGPDTVYLRPMEINQDITKSASN